MKQYTRVQQVLFFLGSALTMMSLTLSSYGIGTATPRLLQQFDAMQYYTLVSLMASVGMLVFLPLVGKLIDTIGRKPMIIIGVAITVVSSFAAGFATNFWVFVVMRAMITVGSACVTPIPSSSLPYVFDKKQLPTVYGIQGAFLALGTFFGSTIAGLCVDADMLWLAVAYPGIITLIGGVIMLVLLPDIPARPARGVDIPGLLLMALWIGGIMYASSFGRTLGWTSMPLLIAYGLIVVGFALFILRESKTDNPLVDLKLFKNGSFTGVLLITFFLVWYQSSMRAYVPLAIQNVMGNSATVSGAVQLPRSILNIICPAFVGVWVAKNAKQRMWKSLAIAGILITLGHLLQATITPASGLWIFYVGLGITGITEAFKQSSLNPSLQATLTRENMGSGMSLNSMMGSMGSALSTAVYGTIQSQMAPDTAVIGDLTGALRVCFLVAAASGLMVAMLATCFVRPKKEVS